MKSTLGILQTVLVTGIAFSGSAVFAQPATTKMVSIRGGCLEVPEGAKVVMTETYADAWVGYVQSPGVAQKVTWAAGMIASRLNTAGNFATTTTKSGDEIKYVGFERAGERGYVARVGIIEFSIAGDSKADLELLLSVARRFRAHAPEDTCERPETQVGKPAF
jgi:hypothetical protein